MGHPLKFSLWILPILGFVLGLALFIKGVNWLKDKDRYNQREIR